MNLTCTQLSLLFESANLLREDFDKVVGLVKNFVQDFNKTLSRTPADDQQKLFHLVSYLTKNSSHLNLKPDETSLFYDLLGNYYQIDGKTLRNAYTDRYNELEGDMLQRAKTNSEYNANDWLKGYAKHQGMNVNEPKNEPKDLDDIPLDLSGDDDFADLDAEDIYSRLMGAGHHDLRSKLSGVPLKKQKPAQNSTEMHLENTYNNNKLMRGARAFLNSAKITDLPYPLSVRLNNVFVDMGLWNWMDILNVSPQQFLRHQNMGKTSLRELKSNVGKLKDQVLTAFNTRKPNSGLLIDELDDLLDLADAWIEAADSALGA